MTPEDYDLQTLGYIRVWLQHYVPAYNFTIEEIAEMIKSVSIDENEIRFTLSIYGSEQEYRCDLHRFKTVFDRKDAVAGLLDMSDFKIRHAMYLQSGAIALSDDIFSVIHSWYPEISRESIQDVAECVLENGELGYSIAYLEQGKIRYAESYILTVEPYIADQQAHFARWATDFDSQSKIQA